jgi:DNA repair exonuclease SbcCD nuclease subunit
MTRVIHTGDTHLGYRQYHSPERRTDFLAAFEAVIEDAIAEDADAVIHAGDLFHDRQPALPDVHGAIGVLRDLREADIPFLAVVGNHERTRDQQWLDLFATLDLATRLGREPTTIGNTAFYGLDFVPRSKRDDLEYDFDPHDADHAALVAHGLFEPFPHADWDTGALLEASPVDFDALLLGDNHTPDRAEVADTWVTYPGSTERADASERDARGYNIVTFEEAVSIRRRGLDTRPFVTLDLELSEGDDAEYVRERIREADVEDAVVIVTIEGDGGEIPAARIEEFATERGALLARVNDRREFDAEGVSEVRFADPDDAVRERLREMSPSEAALGIDETVRDDTVADSNVRGRVTDHVRSLLEADADAFETVAELGGGEGDEREQADSDEGVDTGDEGTDTGDEGIGTGDEGTDTSDEIGGRDTVDGVEDAGGSPRAEDAVDPTRAEAGSTADDPDAQDDSDAQDDPDAQVTMEDYL